MKIVDLEEYMKEREAKKPALMAAIEKISKGENGEKSLRKRAEDKLILLLKGSKNRFENSFELNGKNEYIIK